MTNLLVIGSQVASCFCLHCGLQEGHFLQMCKDCNILEKKHQHSRILMAHDHASTQRKVAQVETGSKLQLARLLTSLFALKGTLTRNDKAMQMHEMLYRLATGGQKPPVLSQADQADPRVVFDDVRACYLGGEGWPEVPREGWPEADSRFHTTEWYGKLRSIFHRQVQGHAFWSSSEQ